MRAIASRWPERERARCFGILLGAMFAMSVVLSWRFGALVENGSFRAGFHRVTRTLSPAQEESYAWVRDIVTTIPAQASVAATPRLGPHVSNRLGAYNITNDVRADYVFADEAELKRDKRRRLSELLRSGRYVRVAKHGSKMLLRKAALRGE
jgi:hypothetical protein